MPKKQLEGDYLKQYQNLKKIISILKEEASGIITGVDNNFYPLDLEIETRQLYLNYLKVIKNLEYKLKSVNEKLKDDKVTYLDVQSVFDYS